jgi:hypothetical protein
VDGGSVVGSNVKRRISYKALLEKVVGQEIAARERGRKENPKEVSHEHA